MAGSINLHSYFLEESQGYFDPKGLKSNDLSVNQKKYKESQELYSSASLYNELLSKIINDPSFEAYSDEIKSLIIAKKKLILDPLIFNASIATRRAELKGYEAEYHECDEKLQNLKTPKKKNRKTATHPDKTENTNNDKDYSYIKYTQDSLKYVFITSPIAFLQWLTNSVTYLVKCLSEFNLGRLSFTFSRISIKNLWLYLKSLGILDAENKIQGFSININVLDYPAQIFNILSVFIFVAKLLINLTLPFKHALSPTNQAEKVFSSWQRFCIEISRAWDTYVNDIFWMVLNAITNFPLMFGVSIPVANWILTGALFFDVAVLSIILYKDEKKLADEIDWLKKLTDNNDVIYITNNILTLSNQNNSQNKNTSPEEKQMFLALFNQARIKRITNRAVIISCILATIIFIASLTLILTLTNPLITPIGFFACAVAVAIILSRKDIAKYADAKASQYIYASDDSQNVKDARAVNAKKAGWQLAKSITEFIFVPVLTIGLFSINWPAAVAFTALYLCIKASGIKLTSSNNDGKNPVQPITQEDHNEVISPLLSPGKL